MIIQGVEIPFGSKLIVVDGGDPDDPRYHTRLAEATFDGKGWVPDDPNYPVWDATDETTGEPAAMSDPMFAVWMARVLWRSSCYDVDMIGPNGRQILIGGWDAPR